MVVGSHLASSNSRLLIKDGEEAGEEEEEEEEEEEDVAAAEDAGDQEPDATEEAATNGDEKVRPCPILLTINISSWFAAELKMFFNEHKLEEILENFLIFIDICRNCLKKFRIHTTDVLFCLSLVLLTESGIFLVEP